jgi:hypothetical protein
MWRLNGDLGELVKADALDKLPSRNKAMLQNFM